MSKVTSKLIGTTLTTSSVFKNESGVVVTPASVNIKYKKPNGAITTTAVTPVSTKYTADILLDVAGVWYFRWESIGSNSVAEEFAIQVTPSSVV